MSVVIDDEFKSRVDIFGLFALYNRKYFHSKLGRVRLSWSSNMKIDAGICWYEDYWVGRRGRMIRKVYISLSENLLMLRPKNDTICILLHEMIHAYMFVTYSPEKEDHGPIFISWMNRISKSEGIKIKIFHSFWNEMELLKLPKRRIRRKRKRRNDESVSRKSKKRKLERTFKGQNRVAPPPPSRRKKKKVIIIDEDSDEEELGESRNAIIISDDEDEDDDKIEVFGKNPFIIIIDD